LSVLLHYPQSIWAIGIVWFAVVSGLIALRVAAAMLLGDGATVARLAGLRSTTAADATREAV